MVFNVVAREFSKISKYDDIIAKLGGTLDDDVLHSKALSQSGLTTAVYEYITSLGVSSAAEMTFAQKLKLSTIALKEQAAAFIASPFGKTVVISAAIFAMVKAIDYFASSTERLDEELAELGQEFKENESKLAGLNNELEETVKNISELEGKDTLTFTEAEELQNLKKQNNELEREIALLKTIQQIKSSERNKSFVETMESDLANAKEYVRFHEYASSNYDPVDTSTKKYGKGRTVRTMSEKDMINSALMRRAEIIEALSGELTEDERDELEALQADIDNYLTTKLTELNSRVESSGVSYIDNPTTEDEKAVNEWLSFIDDFNDKMMIAMGVDGAKENAVERLILGDYAEATKDLQELGEQGAVTADHLADPKYADFINKCIELGIISDDSTESLSFLALAFNTVSEAALGASDSTETSTDTINDSIDDVQSRLSTLSDALAKLHDGSLEVNDVIDLLQKFPELATYVDLTAEGFGDLEKGLKQLIKSSPDSLIDTLQEFKETSDLTEEQEAQIDNLCDALNNMSADAIKDVTGEFGVLAEQINAATAAQTELEKKLAEDDYDAGYEGRVEAYSGFQEVLDAGEYGSKAYAAYKEYFGLLEKSPEQISAWMDANKQYFTEGTDGVVAFMDTVESLSGDGGPLDGIASFDSETGAFWYDINQVSAFAETLDWSEEMLQDFIYKYRMYCEEWESRSPADAMQELTNAGLITQIGNLGDFSPTFASLKELQEYTGLGEQGVYDLIDSINELRAQEGLPNISLISRDITEVTTDMVVRWQNAGATAEEIVQFIMDLAEQGVDIEPNLSFVLDDGTLVDIDTLLAEAGFEDTETVHVEIDMTVNDENVVAVVEATVGEVKEILGDNWEILLSADTEDSEKRIEAVQKLLEEFPASTDVLLNDGTGLVRSSLSNVLDLLDDIDANKTKTITIRYQTIGLPMFAKGTKRATEGSALLGDEYSPTGSPKPELVVSDGRAYLAGQNGPEVGYLHDGDIVYTADETKRILRGNVLHKSIQAHAGGTPVDWSGLSGGLYNSSNTSNGSSSGNSSSGSDDESWFERQYKDHNHWLEMDKESVSDYLDWLDKAYKKAYDEGIIDIDDYYNYEEEVLQKTQDLFKDYLNDIDHEMSMLEAGVGNSNEIINLALQAIQRIEKELAAARAAGLDENGDYIQYLEQQWLNYSQTVTDLREDAETSAKNSVDDLVEYRIKMLKQDIENQKDALNKKLDALQDFYDKQRQMLQDQYDEEKYLEEQSEKRKSVTDIQSELAMLEHDDSAWAQKRKLELQAELSDAQKELNDFEKDHALDTAIDLLDEQQAAQEAQIQAEIEALDEKLNDPHALYNQALADIKNNTQALYNEFIEYNRKYGTGNDEDVVDMWEEAYKAGLEYQDTHNGEHLDDIAIGNYTGYVAPENPKPPESTPSTSTSSTSKTESASASSSSESQKPSLSKGSSIQVKSSATHFSSKSGNVRMASFVPGGTYTVYKTDGSEVLIGRDGVYTGWINKSDIVGYRSGTGYSIAGLAEFDEDGKGSEYIFESSDGSRYRMFGEGSKVLNSDATNFLYEFATSGGNVLMKMLSNLFGLGNLGNITKPVQAIDIHAGDIIVQGNATEHTVSEIRRAQRDNLKYVITEFNKLNK